MGLGDLLPGLVQDVQGVRQGFANELETFLKTKGTPVRKDSNCDPSLRLDLSAEENAAAL